MLVSAETFTNAISPLIILVLFGLISANLISIMLEASSLIMNCIIAIILMAILTLLFHMNKCYNVNHHRIESSMGNNEYFAAIMKAYYRDTRSHAPNMDN